MDKQVYEIWLQQALGYGNYQIKTIFELYKSAKNFTTRVNTVGGFADALRASKLTKSGAPLLMMHIIFLENAEI